MSLYLSRHRPDGRGGPLSENESLKALFISGVHIMTHTRELVQISESLNDQIVI